MSSNNTTNQASYDATVHENPKDEKRWRSIMFRVFLKVAQVVVQSRVNVSHMLSGHEKTSNWFNIELTELPGIDNQVVSVLGINRDRSVKLDTPIRIDIFVETPGPNADSKPTKVVLERWSISLVQSAADSNMDSLQAGYKLSLIHISEPTRPY
eukprot:TRINITY_DN7649_c0_g1_i3.p1 TRINITY_DN7649_c0_g1~~TRINITY_DN7649_c0_g1_i3.p1  ORF type:complete len:154 (+),score=13.48 TRINITY_DN7649_c0_g1_i3:98-559(+)